MMDCKECKHYGGYYDNDGVPACDLELNCPYQDCGSAEKEGLNIVLNMPDMLDYIKHTVQNTVNNAVYEIIQNYVKNIAAEKIKAFVLSYTESAIKELIDNEISEFMKKDIIIGGGWCEKERTLSRNEYMTECVTKVMDDKLSDAKIREILTDYSKSLIETRISNLKDEINRGIKTNFDDATRKALSDNVVSMLMAGDTYKRLSDSMSRMIQ